MDAGATWHPAAAYLYVLHLDGPSLAWEYLRRHPEYRQDWRYRKGRPPQAQRWGLRLLENPDLDARDAQPNWCLDPTGVVQVHPDADPLDDALPFQLWALPGEKQLLHDGRRLLLIHRDAGRTLRLMLSLSLRDGMAHVYAVRASPQLPLRWRTAETTLATLDALQARALRSARDRPRRTTLLHMRTLQALDGVQAGASQRQIAEVLFGAVGVSAQWHSDGQLRAYVRRLIARGRRLMQGGYHRLLHPGAEGGGRFRRDSKRP